MTIEIGEWSHNANGKLGASPDYKIADGRRSVVLSRNCNAHEFGKCVEEDCGLVEHSTYFLKVISDGYGSGSISLSDEQMQELFAVYLLTRKEVGLK